MSIDENTVHKVAKLARIKIEPDQVGVFQARLNSAFDWIAQLDEVDVSQVEPMFSVSLDHMPLRQDQVTDGNCVRDILANAPESDLDMFMVPKVVE